jgi:hypothetical protein
MIDDYKGILYFFGLCSHIGRGASPCFNKPAYPRNFRFFFSYSFFLQEGQKVFLVPELFQISHRLRD